MIAFQDLTFTYPGAPKPAISHVSLQIPVGEMALVAGESGSGKSTLLRCLNGLTPHFSGGLISGQVRVSELDPVRVSPKRMSSEVGFVFQDPENQFVMDIVEDDIAFTLETAGVAQSEIQNRLDNVFARLGIGELKRRYIRTLSGGERQKVAIASAIVLSPRILVLDEPTSQLDPYAAKEILETIVQLKNQLSLTVVIAEHRLERVLPYTDRLIYLDAADGHALSGAPNQVLPAMPFYPPLISLGLRLDLKPLPLSVEQIRPCLKDRFGPTLGLPPVSPAASASASPVIPSAVSFTAAEPVFQLHGVSVKKGERQILHDVDLELYPGEILALIGSNGSGKTTLLRTMAGLQKPSAGWLAWNQKDISAYQPEKLCLEIGYIPQDPNILLFADTVWDELKITLHNHRLPINEAWMNELLSQLGILSLAHHYPRDLSVGQRQRVALGAILVTKPPIILLDEPTRGLDSLSKRELTRLLVTWRGQGKSILLVTHDVEFVAQCADRIAALEQGRLIQTGLPGEILPAMGDFAPQIAQIFPGRGWLVENDLADLLPG